MADQKPEIDKKCNNCSHSNNCKCKGEPAYKNILSTPLGQMMRPVRCDSNPNQLQGPYEICN